MELAPIAPIVAPDWDNQCRQYPSLQHCQISELYLIAAEAAVKGATTQAGKSARELINVIRARAGKWRWDNNGNAASRRTMVLP